MHDHGHDHDHEDSHEHTHEHDGGHVHRLGFHAHTSRAPEAIARALVVTIIFMLVEAIGGWIANSLALLSDAVHMLTDVGAMLLSLFAIWVSRRPSTTKMSFGYHRAEILGALASGLAIWALSGALVYEAILRLHQPVPVQGGIVFVVATIGLLANLISMRMLHHAQHDNMNAKAAYLHMLSDALGSVGAIVAGAVLFLTHWAPIDPIVTIFFAILMLVSSWKLVAEAVGILMESTPTGIDSNSVLRDLESLPKVREVHDLHIWTVSSGRLALSVHLVVEGSASGTSGAGGIAGPDFQDLLRSANSLLEQRHGIIHTTIQIELLESFQLDRCYDCARK